MIISFDLDGTLVDTEDWVLNAYDQAFKKNGLKAKKKDILKYWGTIARYTIKKLFPRMGKKRIKSITKDFEEIRRKTIHLIKPFKDTKKTLKKLRKEHHLVLLSNNSHEKILEILHATKINPKWFDAIIGADEVRKPKPFPNEVNAIKRRLNKKAAFLVGDTKQDIKAAKRAKVRSIIVLTGPNKKKELKRDKPDFIVKKLKHIPKILEAESKLKKIKKR